MLEKKLMVFSGFRCFPLKNGKTSHKPDVILEDLPMHRSQQARGRIRPKISTMPRQRSEAAAFLNIYKLVIEKKRLEQELESLDERRKQICDRIAVLNQHVGNLETSVDQMRAREAKPQTKTAPTVRPNSEQSDDLNTVFLDY
jgi:chromosome segregation ATPase